MHELTDAHDWLLLLWSIGEWKYATLPWEHGQFCYLGLLAMDERVMIGGYFSIALLRAPWKSNCWNDESLSNSHPICIKCSTKTELSALHGLHQGYSKWRVGVGVLAPKILQRNTVNCRVCRCTKFVTQDSSDIRSHHWNTHQWDYTKALWWPLWILQWSL